MHKLERDLKIVGMVLMIFVVIMLVRVFQSPTVRLSKIAEGTNTVVTAHLRGVKLNLTIADTPTERTLGLSGRHQLGEFEGLLFVFDNDDQPAFWMKDMNFPIDIVWLDRDLRVVAVTRHVTPDSFPQTFSPPVPVRYVLELNAGFTDSYNIDRGDRLTLGN